MDAELEIIGIPWEVATTEQEIFAPPAGIWVSRKGDKSYVYELVFFRCLKLTAQHSFNG